MTNWLGIIAEYNPLHTGHLYQLKEAARQTGCQRIVVAMSGNFVQRGEPALVDKWTRARMAVMAGADLVVELPCYHVLQSAEGFARAGVALLDACCVDTISFGSESGQAGKLEALAAWTELESSQAAIRQQLALGVSYATAVHRAVTADCSTRDLAPLLNGPNNILGLEYIRALRTIAPQMAVHTVKRIGPGHRNPRPGSHASATALRQLIASGKISQALAFIPERLAVVLAQSVAQYGPVTLAKFQQAINYSLAMAEPHQLRSLPAVSEGLEQRILALATQPVNLESLLSLAKTRRYPRTRLQRLLCQLLLGFHLLPRQRPLVPYIRVLALAPQARPMLAAIAKRGSSPLVIGWRDAKKLIPASLELLQLDRRSGVIYSLATREPLLSDSRRKPPLVSP